MSESDAEINQSPKTKPKSRTKIKTKTKEWSTWEELLLACAVKRHGFKNWESVAMELQTKTSLPHRQTTAQCCKQKYHDLKRRFKDEYDHEQENKLDNIPWLEQLRKVRVDELKQEVQRYDLSILSLQLKVKRLEEERDHPALDIKNTQQKPDLLDHNISLNDKKEEAGKSSEDGRKVCKRFVSGEESDRENRSVNESNSTGLSEKIGDGELIKNEAKAVGSGGLGPFQSGSKAVESEELGDSVTQLSSDVQSSASFGRKRERDSGDSIKGVDVKSEPFTGLLNMIRTHNHASLFERRLKSQESNEYGEIVRQHVDAETIQRRIEQGLYSSCILTFYRDLLLLFNNAIVYFPKASIESDAAFQLRNLVSNEIKKETAQKSESLEDSPSPPPPPPPPAAAATSLLPPNPKPPLLETADSLLAKQKSSAPPIVCRKRSSVSAKQSSSSSDQDKKPPVERTSLLKVETEDKAITTGARSSRRSNRNPNTNTPPPPPPPTTTTINNNNNRKQNAVSKADKQETTPKAADKKKTEASTASDKKKSVVDFLKRIKKNSPVQKMKKGKGASGGEGQKRNKNSGGKKDKGKERVLWRSSSEKKQAKEENSPSKRSVGRPAKKTGEASGKRGRESGGGKEVAVVERQTKRPRR